MTPYCIPYNVAGSMVSRHLEKIGVEAPSVGQFDVKISTVA